MGDGHDEPPQTAPRGRTPLKRRPAKKPRAAKPPGPRDSVSQLKRALADVTAREAHLTRLLAINTRISALDSTEAVLTSIAEEAARLLGLDNTAFRIIDGDELVLAACAGSGRDVTTQKRIRIGESLSGRVFAAGKTLEFSIDEMAPVMIPEHVAADRRLGYTTFLGVPLRVDDRITGVLALRARRPFDARERELAEAFAAQAAVVLEHARLYEETQRARRQAERHARNLTALTDVTAAMTSARSSENVFAAVTAAATRLLGARMARVWVVDAGAGVFRSHRGHASDAEAERALDDYSEVPIGRGILGRIFATRSPEYVADAWTDERWYSQKFVRDVGLHTFVGLPLVSGDRVLGVLSLLFGDQRPWSADDAELGALLANQAAIAIANADLHRAREQRAARMRALARLNQIVSSSLDTESVLATIARTAVELVGAPFVHFWVLNPDRNVLEVGASSPGPAAEDFGRPALDVNHGAAGWVARHRLPLEVADVHADGRFFAVDWLRRHGLRSFYGMPLLLDERLLGVLALFAPEPFRFTDDDHELLDAFAGQAAVALNNARLYREARESGDRVRALERVNRLISSSLEVPEVLGNVAGAVAEFFDAPFVSVWRYDEVGRRLHRALIHGETVVASELHAELDVGAGAVGWVVQNRAPIPWVEVSTDPRIVDAPQLLARGLKYFTAYPIAIGDRVLGAFAVSAAEPSTGTEALSLMASLGAQAAVALDHARLYGETTRRLDQTAALLADNTRLYDEVRARLLETSTLLAVGQLLSDRTPQPEAMRRVAREVGRALGADMVGAYFLDERREQLVPLTGYHVPSELLEHFVQRPIRIGQFPLLQDSWNAGRASWSPDPANDPRFDKSWFEGLPQHSVLIAPAIAQGEPRGALFLVWWQPGREFSAAEIALVEAVGRQVGLALENAELARQTEAKLRETETLLSVAGALGSTLDLSGLFRHLLRQVHQIISSDSVGLWMVGEDGDSILPRYGYRVPPEIRESTLTLRPSVTRDAFYAQAAQTRQPVVSRDAMNDPGIPDSVKTVVPHRSQLFVPIVVNDRMVGGIAAIWRERVCEFSERDLALLGAVARHAGVAIENARLFTENLRQVERLSMLHELSRAVTGQLDRAAVLAAVSTQVARVFDVQNMVMALYDEMEEEYDVILRIRNGQMDPATPWRNPMRIGLASVVLRSGQALRTDDYAGECARRGLEPQMDYVPFPYWLGAPMSVGGRVMGAIAVRSAERPFTVDDERLLGNIGDLAALALRSANLFEERSRAYRDLAAAQDQLVRTEKLRALGEMASGVAHDFNNLLAAILGRAQLVLNRLTDPKLRQWVGVIERAAIDGAQTVRRLQEFTRIRRDEPLVAVDLNQIVQGALDITQSRWREEALSRGVTIEVRQSLGPVGEIAGDAAELREALTNLILNAVDAMPQGGTLRLETTTVADGVQLVVADTGIGMPDSVRSRIFDPFFTTKGPRGTGLGLSITYGILSRHGATLDVETGEGRGTAFRLVFPRAEKLLRAQPAPDVVAVETTTPLSCLVVDDDEAVGTVIGDMIEASGHKALVLQEPAEAIARAQLAPFDVVFTDLAMPGLSGWEVARDIKTRRPDVPIFMMTGFGVELSDDERARHGLEAVLVKPLRIEDILTALARATERRGGRS